jgi:hypothetical protein
MMRADTFMNAADFDELSEAEKRHYECKQWEEMVDMRQLDDVLFHEDHVQRPDIQYGGSKRLRESLDLILATLGIRGL